ncbi:hypothetical protein [Magnetospirillum sp. SS-4]|uniref:hypothetical protein n=1 Tax=Magnetospirillum sp. SS-4 TaxID=2681465 RepID=UPI001385B30B|nr:hypothetical protein [Magnetospirillum sp. SS-4]CAA7622290.1 conserved hypothetical protein [Magnetospirillum sp. SS-4]
MVGMLIRLFSLTGGVFSPIGEDCSVEDFGGAVPVVGDLIVIPGVRAGLDRQNREVAEVVRRYLIPGADGSNRVGLIVTLRSGKQGEINILGKHPVRTAAP